MTLREEILVSIGLEQKKIAIFFVSHFGNNPSCAKISVLPHPVLQSSRSLQILAEVSLLIPNDKNYPDNGFYGTPKTFDSINWPRICLHLTKWPV